MSETNTYSFSGEPGLRLNPYTPEDLQEIRALYLPEKQPPESPLQPPCDPYAKPIKRDCAPRSNIRADDTGLHAFVPFPNELPIIRIRFRDGNTTFIFSGSYEGRHSLTAKLLKRMENDPDPEVVY